MFLIYMVHLFATLTNANAIQLSMGEVNQSVSSRNCERGSEKGTKQRKKASRACDQCRRKRIKCRFDKHTGVCQGCLEVGEKCQFIRVPLKRGPAKKRASVVSNENSARIMTLFNTDQEHIHTQ